MVFLISWQGQYSRSCSVSEAPWGDGNDSSLQTHFANFNSEIHFVKRKAHYAAVNAAYTKAAGELADLKAEIIRSIRGESALPKDVLAELIRENETKCLQLEAASEQAKNAMVETEAITKELQRQHDEILSFADLYDSAGIEAKKMVVSAMIRRVEVSRDYKLKIFFNFNLDQFLHGLDCGGTIQAGGV